MCRTAGAGPKSVDVLGLWVTYRYVVGGVVGEGVFVFVGGHCEPNQQTLSGGDGDWLQCWIRDSIEDTMTFV
jgi:hypothetical protein